MSNLLRAELLKLRTTRTFIALAGIAIGTSVLIAVLVAVLTEPTQESVLVDVFASDTSSLFILILAVVGISGEWRHRTITSSLLAAPERTRFLAAKTVAFGATGVVLSVLIAAAVAIAGATLLTIRDLPLPELDALAGQVVRNAFVAAALGALGIGLGALVRNQVVAIVGLFIVMFVGEPLVVAFAPRVGRWAPLGVLPAAAAGFDAEDVGLGDLSIPTAWAAAAALLAWVAALLIVSALLLRRRDLE